MRTVVGERLRDDSLYIVPFSQRKSLDGWLA